MYSQVIYKYTLKAASIEDISVPKDAKFLKVAAQGNDICVWFQCNKEPLEVRTIQIHTIATGVDFDDYGLTYRDSVVMTMDGFDLVFHIYMKDN